MADQVPSERSESSWKDSPAKLRSRAVKASAAVLTPFLLAALLALGFRYWAIGQAADSVAILAMEVSAAKASPDPDKALQRLADVTQTDDASAKLVRPRLVHSLAAALSRGDFGSEPDRKTIARHVQRSLLKSMLPADVLMMSVLVLVFPAFFCVMFFQAARELSPRYEPTRQGQEGTLEGYVTMLRQERWLTDEARWLFWRRAAFALVIALGVNYLISPAGLQASISGQYAALGPPAGFSSHPFGFQYFAVAPPYVVGFAGYYLYALTACSGRLMSGSLSHRFLPSLLNRAIVVTILGLVLSGITEGESLTRALVFITAIFPEKGIQYLAKLSQSAAAPLGPDLAAGFRALPELDINKQAALAELGVSSIHDLARADWLDLVATVGINPHLLLRAADRSLLLHSVGIKRAAGLAKLSIYTASDVVLYAQGADAYRARWHEVGLKVRYELGDQLDESTKASRLDAIAKALKAHDASLLVQQLANTRNVRVAIDNEVSYGSG